MHIGMHLSIAGGFARSVLRAGRLGCPALQIFVQNPRSWRWRPLSSREVEDFSVQRQRQGVEVVAAHLSYLPNLAAADHALYQRSWARFREEQALAKALALDYLVCHPGHAPDPVQGRQRLLAGLIEAVTASPPPPLILLENTAGQKNELGADLAELSLLITQSQVPLGLCLDTAHAFAAGYDLGRVSEQQRLAQEIGAGPGLAALQLIHLNDSLLPCGSRRDRHWHLGQGHIGLAALASFLGVYAQYAQALILETPQKEPGDDVRNLAVARHLMAAVVKETAAAIPPMPDQNSGRR